MISALIKGVQQLGDRRTQKPLAIGVALAVGVFVVLWFTMGALITHTALFELAWLETLADGLGWALVLVLTWVLFPGVVSASVALFLDQVVESVEARHYPGLTKAPGQPFGDQVVAALRFLGVMVLLNLLLLPFMLLGPVYPLLFYGVNGYLLGREYFEMVASRRLALRDVIQLRRAHGSTLFLTGAAIAVLLTVPVVNLLAPVVATAAMVHLFEAWRGRAGAPGTSNTMLDQSRPEA